MTYSYQDELLKSLESGFIDRYKESNPLLSPQLITNDKIKQKKVLSTIQNELRNCDEFWFNVAFVTSGGVATIINELKILEQKNIKGKILVSQYQNFTQPEALIRLLQFKNIELKIVTEGNMHAKGYLFRKGNLFNYIVGSSNLTDNALKVNQELNIKISATSESDIIYNTLKDFETIFYNSTSVNKKFIEYYHLIYNKQLENKKTIAKINDFTYDSIKPNKMQVEALAELEKIRIEGKKKALLISATGTGKTYLSAFDVKKVNPKKFLFIVHRETIAKKSLESFKQILGDKISMGVYSGSIKEKDCDYLFSTIQTISKDEELRKFNPHEFEYIVIDETHRAGAESYKKIMGYFKPIFMLGMTATPERTDGYDIYKSFDYNIAYEIRLHKALDEDMLSPFHYYGITDLSINNEIIDDKSDFNKLTSNERINHILHYMNFYGCDNGNVRGLIFCSRTEEAIKLSELLNIEGLRTIALTSKSLPDERKKAIERLEESNSINKLDYIITVDIFNEGVDIPKINQVVMLRPTQSSIIFVQQLGRGLRKADNKEYLTVLDFIGNYSNNFLVPIALFGENSYNKDNLRKLLSTGSDFIPGASTISFDEISKKRIFESIDKANLNKLTDLKNDYYNLEYKIGRTPMMFDFVEHGSRDPYHYIKESRSLYNFSRKIYPEKISQLNAYQIKLLELYSIEIANGNRVEELLILKDLINNGTTNRDNINKILESKYKINLKEETYTSAVNVLNFDFINKKLSLFESRQNELILSEEFNELLKNNVFKLYLLDIIKYGIYKFDSSFDYQNYFSGFILYKKYSRKDVCRILNWDKNEESTLYGYKIKHNTCPIFVNYHKENDIDPQINFPEGFIDTKSFQWFSKPYLRLENNSIQKLKNFKQEEIKRFPFFIKKHNGEGSDFYYMGDVLPVEDSFEQSTLLDKHGKQAPVVKIKLDLNIPVELSLYNYLIEDLQ